ncbi:cupin domain-containing protein [Methylibium sp.]|uniref:cupin domain-containing protein n=1 Tax=Methylibium sp. TaxID=2067992 RepID=UPI003D136820
MSDTPRPFDDQPLDSDTLDALTAAAAAEPVPGGVAARIKHRLLGRMAQGEARHVTVQAADGAWQAFQEGVQIKVLHEADGVMSYLLRLRAGAVLPAHRHPTDEECVVLEGSLRIGNALVLHAGGFHLARQDALHAAITTDTGATIYLRGASPHPGCLV